MFAIDVLHGTPVWVDNAGSITASPVLVGDHVYVASRAGSVRAYLAGGDDYGGASLDWVTATPGPIASDLTVSDHLIAFALAAGSIGVLNDTGTWAASLLPVGVGTAANTAPVLHPSDRRIYAGANDGAAWQFDLTGVSAHQSISSARTTACCDPVLVVDSNADATTSVNLVIGTSLGDLAKLAIPWPAEPGHA